jgi:hypothetical protein
VRLRALRITIVGMMAVVLACGVAFAALRDASDVWEGAVLMATVSILGAAILGSRSGRASDRAWWQGFALFGWGYLIATMAPWFGHEVGTKLPTSMALNYLQRLAVGAPKSATLTGNVSIKDPSYSITTESLRIDYPDGRTTIMDPKGEDVSLLLGRTARTALPGAINREAFLRVGHCSFAFLAAIIGALIGRHFYSAEEQLPEPK